MGLKNMLSSHAAAISGPLGAALKSTGALLTPQAELRRQAAYLKPSERLRLVRQERPKT